MRRLTVAAERWPLKGSFAISRGAVTAVEVVVVTIEEGAARGRGECRPYARYGESLESVTAQIESVRGRLEAGLDREELQNLLPAGAARNAVDCALWDLEAKQRGEPVWQLAGLPPPRPATNTYTLAVGSPEEMGKAAAAHAHCPLLKLKLAGEGDIERVQAVRQGAPQSRLIIDANEGWRPADYEAFVTALHDLGVEMIEQPFPAGEDQALAELPRPIPLCADESCHDRGSLPQLAGRYDIINIKLDKTGGLTEALALKQAAIEQGFAIMVGCMMATSLAMAPAMLLTEGAKVVDLDAPLWLAEDRPAALAFDNTVAEPPQPELWG